MRKRSDSVGFLLLMVVMFFSNSTMAAHLRFPCGFTSRSGSYKIMDIYEGNLKAEGLTPESSKPLPVTLSFSPYIQFDNGCCIGSGLGPFMLILGDADFIDMPVKLDFRYTFIPLGDMSSYLRTGLSYHLARGDYVKESNIGLSGGIGVELLKRKRMGFGLEIAYDAAEIEVEKKLWYRNSTIEKVQPCKYTLSMFLVFGGFHL